MSKDKDPSGALGNKDSGKRGRGGETVIGQTIPKKVLGKIQPKQPKNEK
jgi:hypothetical protein